jgi:hypothetical protein
MEAMKCRIRPAQWLQGFKAEVEATSQYRLKGPIKTREGWEYVTRSAGMETIIELSKISLMEAVPSAAHRCVEMLNQPWDYEAPHNAG